MNENDRDKKEGQPAHPTVEPPVPHVDSPYGNEPTAPFPTKPAGIGDTEDNPELTIRR